MHEPNKTSQFCVVYKSLSLIKKVTKYNNYSLFHDPKFSKARRRTYSRLCLFTTRLNCRDQVGSRQFSVHCADWATYTLTTRSRPSDHGAIWCLDTHQELQQLWLADTLRRSPPDSPGELAEMWGDWGKIQSLVTRDLVSGRANRKSGRNR